MRSRHVRFAAALRAAAGPADASSPRAGAARRRSARRCAYDGHLVFTRLIYGSGLRRLRLRRRRLVARLPGGRQEPRRDPRLHQPTCACGWTAPTCSTSTTRRSSRTRSSTCGSRATGRSRPARRRDLREYLLKGGFVIFDDFEGPEHWDNMTAQMKRALPDHDFIKIDERHTDLPVVLQHQQARRAAPVDERDAGLLGDVREQRSRRPHDRAGQPQQRHRRVLGVVGRGTLQPGPAPATPTASASTTTSTR